MSPHWPETLMNIGFGTLYGKELRLRVQPTAIELNLLKRDLMHGFKAQIIKRQQIESTENCTAQALSANLLRKLSATLAEDDWHHAAPTVVLSSDFVHYVVLPWNPEIKSKQEREAYLQHTFALHFGEQSKAWHLSAHDAGYGKAAIASGVERSLLEQLQAVFADARMPLKAVHPLLMLATNQALKHLKKFGMPQSFWLVSLESKRLTLALVENGDWKRVWNMAAEADIGTQIHTLIQREAVLEENLAKLPILQYGHGERLALARVIQLSDAGQEDGFAHSIQPKWAVR